MRLEPGSDVGVYKVVALLGTGGMGEVYRATDNRLNRDVALKILKDSFAQDPDRVGRFRREAQLLASLNHPHIGAIYGFEEAGRVSALVLELVEGPTLADRIARGALPVQEALGIARQIADALDAAHERGIVHRDLKPANIKLRPDGTVKVLDFGLAKALDQAAGSGLEASADLTNSPTMTSPAVTGAGLLLGTAAYMSPEQARGQSVDKRADIWAFGCVLLEMLTGRGAFEGHSVSDVLASVLRSEPPWAALPAEAMPFRPVLQRCLEKDVRRRLRDIGDVRLLLEEALATPAPEVAAPAPSSGRGLGMLAIAAGLGAMIAGSTVALVEHSRANANVLGVRQFQLAMPESSPLTADVPLGNVAISPDGSRMVYTSTRGGVPMIVMRRFDQQVAEPIAGSEGGIDPLFSPDSQHVAFATFKEFKTVDVAGGPSVTLFPIDPYFAGASWGGDNSIVFAQGSLGLFRAPASGGASERIAVPDASKQERAYLRPQALPGGAILYTTLLTDGSTRIVARRAGERDGATVVPDGFDPHYLTSGHLVYGQSDRLMAVRFDLSTLKTDGAPVLVEEGVFTKLDDRVANVSAANDGTAVFVSGHHAAQPSGIIWLDPAGGPGKRALGQGLEFPRNLRLSPDGRRVAVAVGPPGLAQLWVYALDGSKQPLKLTFHDHNIFPVWSPDGRQIAFMTRAGGGTRLVSISSDGSEVEPKPLMDKDEEDVPWGWSPDGAFLLFAKMPGKLWLFHPADKKATPWLPTPFAEGGGSFSPDGRWMAYSSSQTGADEIWVRPFPGPGAPVRVSDGGGKRPIWKRDGKEIFFEQRGKVLSARVTAQMPDFRVDAPRVVLEGGFMFDETDSNLRYVDLAPDGRFIAVEAAQKSSAGSIVLVQHFDKELARLLPK